MYDSTDRRSTGVSRVALVLTATFAFAAGGLTTLGVMTWMDQKHAPAGVVTAPALGGVTVPPAPPPPRPANWSPPPVLTQAEVDAMDENQVMSNWARVARSRGEARAAGDTQLEQRLRDEFEMLKQRKMELTRMRSG